MHLNKGLKSSLLILFFVLAFTVSGSAKTVEFVIPWSAGGGSDTMARFLVKSIKDNKLTDADFVVVNKVGGNGQIASAHVMKRKGRPNTWMTLAFGQISIPLAGLGKIKATDFTALAQVAGDVNLLVVAKDSPFKSVADVAAAAKAKPGKLNVGGSATAAEDHICTYLLEKATGTKMNYTAFSGGGQVMSNLMGGHIDVAWANPNECISQVKGGLVRMLAVTKEDRLALLPDVPSFKELGFDLVFWQVRGIHGPPNMPQEAIDWSVKLLKKATETDTWNETGGQHFTLEVFFIPGADYTKVIKENEEMFREALGAMGFLKE